MNKIERFYNSLGEPVQVNNGDYGYFVTVGDLVKNGGNKEFFRKVRKSGRKVSKDVFYGLEYDNCDRAYYAANWNDCSSHSILLIGACATNWKQLLRSIWSWAHNTICSVLKISAYALE